MIMNNELHDLIQKVIPPVITRSAPFIADHGRGVYIYDTDGNRYLDMVSGIGVNVTGHCHPRIVEAAVEQTRKLIHITQFLAAYESNIKLAGRLAELLPGKDNMLYFSNSGAEAVEGAVKLARYFTGRSGLIVFRRGFHGRTLATTLLSSSKARFRQGYEGMVGGIHYAPYAYCYRCDFNSHPEDCSLHCLKQLEVMLSTEIPATDVAAILIEPVLGEGGYVNPPSEFLQGVREIANRHGLLLIFDEIQTGFGRTGKMFALEHSGVAPDIVIMAKAMASGFPLSAFAARPEIFEKWPRGSHGGTYGGNPVSCAAGLATLDVIEEENLVQNSEQMGVFLTGELKKIQGCYPEIGDVRGPGLMVGVEFIAEDMKLAAKLVENILSNARERGLLLFNCGSFENVIRFIPPLIVTREQLQDAVSVFNESISVSLTSLKNESGAQ